jgi:hypothetical protein
MKDKKLEQIEQILITHDPVKLVKMGSPTDEYDSEALDIYERVNRYNSVDKMQQIIYDVFVSRFSGGDRYEMIDGVLTKTGKIKPSKEAAKKIIGAFDSYREIAEQVKKVVGNT